MRSSRRRLRWLGAVGAITASITACTTTSAAAPAATGRPLPVVAAENFWGSVAAQLGGDRVRVRSIITNPDTDPHAYEPTPADARALASAAYAISNGVGYDPWVSRLLDANPQRGRAQLDVGALTGVKPGGNPHRWYSPLDVHRVIDRITADYERLAPADAPYFEQQRATYLSAALGPYDALIADIKAKYAGMPIGASESVVEPLASALGLDVVTRASFLRAISEGSEPTAADKSAVDAQIKTHRIKVYIFNRQNSTPDVKAQVDEATAAGIPVVAFTETLVPPGASFQAWQVGQLRALEAALAGVAPR